MRRLALPLLALCLAAPARAWRLFGEPSDGKVRPVQELNDAGKPREVLAALTPAFVQTLRGTDLRQAYILMGDSHDRLGRADEAVSDYQLGVSLFPKNVDLLSRLGMILHREGLDEQAKPLLLRVIAIEPQHGTAHTGLAEIDRRLGFLTRSAEHYEVALESLDARADLWRDYAEVLLELREFKTADLALRKSLELDPKNPDARVLLASARHSQGDLAGAVDDLDAALGLGAGVGARRAEALYLLEGGRLDDARERADEVLKEVPGDGAALWVLARVSLAAGDSATALRLLASVKPDGERNAFATQAAKALARRVRVLDDAP